MKSYKKWGLVFLAIFTINALLPVPILNTNFFTDTNKKVHGTLKSVFVSQHTYHLPKKLRVIPDARDMGVLLDTFILDVQDSYAPYNPTLLEKEDHYEVFFRQDVKKNKVAPNAPPYSVFIKKANFSKDFKQISYSTTLDLGSNSAEDPRVISQGSKDLIVFNDSLGPIEYKYRNIFLANLTEPQKESSKLDVGLQKMEKNWTPFLYNNQLHFVYKILPMKVIKYVENSASHSEFVESMVDPIDIRHWKWGEPRGGTPAIHIGSEYLGLFHSFFTHDGLFYYVAGAYTFEDKPPFKLKKISRIPLKFDEMYSSPLINTADPNKRVLYPSGLVRDEKNPDYLWVLCGENDSSIRVLKLNLPALLHSMMNVEEEALKTSLSNF